jgi:hypothetical protein
MKADTWLGLYLSPLASTQASPVLVVLGQVAVVQATADQALDAENGVFGVGDGLALGRLADKALVVREGNDRGRGARPFRVLDNAGLAAIHDGNAGVRGS